MKRLQDAGRALWIARELRQRERWPREDISAFQASRLAALIKHAVSASPFYREWYGSDVPNHHLALEELPVLTKATMMEHLDCVLTDRRLTLSQLERHVDGLTHDQYYLGRYRALVTSGTAGLRGLFVYDRSAWSAAIASALRSASMMGVSPRIPGRLRYAFVGAPGPVHMSNRLPASADVGLYRMLRLEATRPIDELVHSLNAFQPDIVQAYPSIGALLAIEQQEGRLRIRPRIVTTTGEMRTPEMEQRILDGWSVRPYNLYAMTEVGIVGSDCPEHQGIHLNEDLAIFEAVDEAGRPVPSGSPSHKLLVTNLFNYTQPLIRYEISDMLTMAPEPCPCGRTLALVGAIEGRNDDMLLLRGRRSGRASPPDSREQPSGRAQRRAPVPDPPRRARPPCPGCARARGLGSGVHRGVADSLRESLSKLPVQPPPIEVRVVDSIPREGGQAAKLKLIRSLVAVDSARGEG